MGRNAIKRFLTVVPVLADISIIVFSFIYLIPGVMC
jgi:ABC-type dipeptide/oligopeptide/nickel transport system permease component